MLYPVVGGFVSIPTTSGSSSIPIGNTLYVDAVNGNDSTGTRGRLDKPYLTLASAKSAASSGDTIIVSPGTYTVIDSILKNGVNWYFQPNTVIQKTSSTDGVGILDDKTNSITCVIGGYGTFSQGIGSIANVAISRAQNANSNIFIHAYKIVATSGSDQSSALVRGDDGKLFVEVDILGGGCYTSIYWVNGDVKVKVKMVKRTFYLIWSNVTTTPTGDLIIDAQELGENLNTATIFSSSSEVSAATWVNCPIIHGDINWSGSDKLYLNTQKVFGGISITGGLVYLNIDKLAPNVGFNYFFAISGGTSWINIKELDSSILLGGFINSTFSNGTIKLSNTTFTGISSDKGFSCSGATLSLVGCQLDFSANAGTAESITVTVSSQPTGGAGSYFNFDASGGTYSPWFFIDAIGSAPGVTNPIQVSISSTDDANTIAAAIATAITTASIGVTASATTGVVTITDNSVGQRNGPSDNNTGFSLNVVVSGSNPANVTISSGTLNVENSIIHGGTTDLINTGGTLNVAGGHGSGTSGHFTTAGSINFLTPN